MAHSLAGSPDLELNVTKVSAHQATPVDTLSRPLRGPMSGDGRHEPPRASDGADAPK